LFYKHYKGWLRATLFILLFLANAHCKSDLIVCDDGSLVGDRAIGEIVKIGTEVKEKTGVSIYLCVKKSINNQKIKLFEQKLTTKLKKPFILLTMAKKEQKVDIMTSPKASKLLDIDEVLSPFHGTIIPILTSRKSKDKYSAAMLNGYADIADRVSQKVGVKLDSSIGNTNRVLFNIVRILVYGSILYFIIMYIRKKILLRKRK